MRACYFWYKEWPLAREMASLHAPWAEHVWTGPDDYGYWRQFAQRWGGDDLVMIEGDVAIHENVIPSFSECDEDWCAFPWTIGGTLNPLWLGCVKFSRRIQQRVTINDIMCPVAHLGDAQCKGAYCDAGPDHPGGSGCWNRHNSGCPDCGAYCYRHLDGPIISALQITGRLAAPHMHLPPVTHLHYE